MTKKTCNTCWRKLDRSKFSRRPQSADGLKGDCKFCRSIIDLKYKRENREKMRVQRAGYYQINRDAIRERVSERRRNNQEKFNECQKAYRKLPRVKEARYRYNKKWQEENPLAVTAHRIVASEVAAGRLIPPKRCSKCKKKRKVQAHHEDYTKPLKVKWECAECHAATSKENRDSLTPDTD